MTIGKINKKLSFLTQSSSSKAIISNIIMIFFHHYLFITLIFFFENYTTNHFKPCHALSTSSISSSKSKPVKICIIGGGASGMFAASSAASELKSIFQNDRSKYQVKVLEGSQRTMTKVSISGGGRCNVIHDVTKPIPELLNNYPRGKKELNGLLNKYFSPTDAKLWFEKRGVTLKTESDGRMFPTTDSSQTIIDCILHDLQKNNVVVETGKKVSSIERISSFNPCDGDDGKTASAFLVKGKSGNIQEGQEWGEMFDCIILATGSSPLGYELASNLGHEIISPVPSLFTFNTKQQVQEGGVFHGLSGVSLQNVKISLKVKEPNRKNKKVLIQEGPLLITHHGISGPAALRLSAFAAHEFNSCNYNTPVFIHWAPDFGSKDDIETMLWSSTINTPKKTISSTCPLIRQDGSTALPRRLWSALVSVSGFEEEKVWGEAPKKKVSSLAEMISNFELQVTSKGIFKDEFVTAGGISLKEINMQTMESKICPGLYLCGEVIDVDGVTGGFNFQNCWSTGFVAGKNAAMKVTS